MFAANLFGRRMVNFWESILGRIPLVRTIYTSVKQVLETFFGSDSRPFRKVVLVEYPKEDVWCLGFLSNKGLEKACEKTGRPDLGR